MLKVEMLSTGDEVLHGQIVDSNAAWLADYFFNQGLPLWRRNTVGDALQDLVSILQERSQACDVLIVNGGLGPTSDDLTAEAAAQAAGVGLVLNSQWLAKMTRFLGARAKTMTQANRKQAMLPQGCEMVDNPIGTACGFALQLNRCLLFFTPGVPSEFKLMVKQQIMPRLQQRFTLPAAPICLRLTTFGCSESELGEQLSPLNLPDEVVIGYRSSMPIIELKLTGPASKKAQMEALWPEVERIAGQSVIYQGTEGLAAQLANRLTEKQLSLALSEQFSAGLLCLQLTNAQAALVGSEVLAARPETLKQLIARIEQLASQQSSDLVLAIGALEDDLLNIALRTPAGSFGLRVKLSIGRHSLTLWQETAVIIAQNLLRRWLNGWQVTAPQGWLQIIERY